MLFRSASSDERILAVTGGFDIALARVSQDVPNPNVGSLSMGASASANQLDGAITAQIDGASTLNAGALTLLAQDGSAIGAYALSGAMGSGTTALGHSFNGALVGAGTGNSINRPVAALIGSPEATSPGTGSLLLSSASLTAQRSAASRIVADAGGRALTDAQIGRAHV